MDTATRMPHTPSSEEMARLKSLVPLHTLSESVLGELLADAAALEAAGCFAIVLECIPEPLGKQITDSIGIPTIGIGAGRHCDGQVLVFHDLLGLAREHAVRDQSRDHAGGDDDDRDCDTKDPWRSGK